MESWKTYHTYKGISLQRFYHVFCLKSYSPHRDTRSPAFVQVNVLIHCQTTTRVFIPCKETFIYCFATVSSQDLNEKHMFNIRTYLFELNSQVKRFYLRCPNQVGVSSRKRTCFI